MNIRYSFMIARDYYGLIFHCFDGEMLLIYSIFRFTRFWFKFKEFKSCHSLQKLYITNAVAWIYIFSLHLCLVNLTATLRKDKNQSYNVKMTQQTFKYSSICHWISPFSHNYFQIIFISVMTIFIYNKPLDILNNWWLTINKSETYIWFKFN